MPKIASKPSRPSAPVPASTLTTVLIGVVVIAALYFGREVLVPIALAMLLSFVLAPLVQFLQTWHFPRGIAVMIVGIAAFAAIFGLGALMVSQVNQLASELPGYQATLRAKIQSVRGVAGGTGTLERASQVLQDLNKEIDNPTNGPASRRPPSSDRPLPVEVIQPEPSSLQTLAALITPLIQPLTTTGIVVIFVIFILIQRQDLRNRLVRLAGARDLQRTTAALDDAGQRLSRLFLTQLALNAGFGLVVGVGLWFIGVPSAPLWGMLAMIMRFVPYVGALISAIFPLVLAAAVSPGWTMVLETAVLFLVGEAIVGQGLEPLAHGQSTGLSPVAVIASATFWTWLWGPIGLVLATPLSTCLVVVGRHVDRLEFLDVMFGDEPPLTPAELVYQRMLARDPVEAAEQARIFLKAKPLVEYYDEILLKALKLAQLDAERGLLDEDRMQRVRDAIAEIVDDLNAHEDTIVAPVPQAMECDAESPLAQLDRAETSQRLRSLPEAWRTGKPVLCIPGIGLLDEGATILLTHLVERQGIGARSEQADALSMSRIFGLDTKDVALVCLCYVDSATPAQIRYAVRRVRRKAPEAIILVSLFGSSASIEGGDQDDTEAVQRTLAATVDKIVVVASGSGATLDRPSTTGIATGQ